MALTRIIWALNLIIAVLRAMQMIPLSYPWTVALAYCLFALSGIEVIRERSLRGWPRLVAAILVITATIWFTVVGPLARAPLKALAYTRPGNYSPGVEIGSISWNPHFTELRVAVTNPTASDYRDTDVLLKPDGWTHKASMITNPSQCELLPVSGETDIHVVNNGNGGATSVTATVNGSGLDVYDNAGDIFATFASEEGYRLRCTTLPSHYTVQIVFALVDVGPFRQPHNLLQQVQKTWELNGSKVLLNYEELADKNALDILGPKPPSKKLSMTGSYIRGIKPYFISIDLDVNGKETDF